YEIVYERPYRGPFRTNVLRSELGFRLGFKDRFLHFDGNRADDGGTDIGRIEIFFIELTYRFHYGLTEGSLVGPSLSRMLAVYKRVVFFTVLLAVGNGYLNIFALQVDDRITHRFSIDVSLQQIPEPMLGDKFPPVEVDG